MRIGRLCLYLLAGGLVTLFVAAWVVDERWAARDDSQRSAIYTLQAALAQTPEWTTARLAKGRHQIAANTWFVVDMVTGCTIVYDKDFVKWRDAQ